MYPDKKKISILLLMLWLVLSATALAAEGPSVHGQLRVQGSQLTDAKGQPVVLRGMSTHGMQWFPQFANGAAFHELHNRGANLIRIAMYTDQDGYIANPAIKTAIYQAIDAAIAQDMYVIIDWHILNDSNPRTYENQARQFFAETSQRYAGQPALLYEICNEPNQGADWQRDIKPYAEDILTAIRKNAPAAIVIVGTPNWSQQVDTAAQDPLSAPNIMYACHFYAGTHGQWLRDKIDAALAKQAAVFISEWGTSAADGSGGIYLDSAEAWLQFMASRKLSWANWSLCDKSESSAALLPGTPPTGPWTNANLSPSGAFVFAHFTNP